MTILIKVALAFSTLAGGLLLTYFLAFYNNEDNSVTTTEDPTKLIACTPESRKPDQCPAQNDLVCSFFSGTDCSKDNGEFCQRLSNNGCIACLDSTTVSFRAKTCDSKRVYCDKTLRPQTCDGHYEPVCGYYKIGCQDDSCLKNHQNPCSACSDSKTLFYEQEDCPWMPTLQQSDQQSSETVNPNEQSAAPPAHFAYCDPQHRPSFCVNENSPVCAYFTECFGGSCTQTISNGCEACAHLTVMGYLPFACEAKKVTCDPSNRPSSCMKVYEPVCAFYSDCSGDQCYETMLNGCEACSGFYIDHYVPGECPAGGIQQEQEEPITNDHVFCEPAQRTKVCTEELNPVCAFKANCQGADCAQTMSNPCQACNDPTITFYMKKECDIPPQPEPVDPRVFCKEEDRSEICPAVVIPVCAYKSDCQGDSCSVNAGNGCEACTDSSIQYFIPGTCPAKEVGLGVKTYCDPFGRPRFCSEDWEPVCGTFTKCAIDGSCHRTAANPCQACRIEDVEYHTPGECPPVVVQEDAIPEKFYCEPDVKPETCDDYKSEVCAYKNNCDGDDCSKTAKNDCEACREVGILYYTEGSCPVVDIINEKILCQPEERTALCPGVYIPVCAYKFGCVGDGCGFTAENQCKACSDLSIEYYMKGECNEPQEPEVQLSRQIYCDPNNRDQVCSEVLAPVCGHIIGCTEGSCSLEATNGCNACNNEQIEYYTTGSCSA